MRSRGEVALDILPGPLETIGTVLRVARCKFNLSEASTSRCSCCINLKNYFSSDGAFFTKQFSSQQFRLIQFRGNYRKII